MIDIHCHLLPNVDDGPESIEESLDLCELCVANGITHAICTPHIFTGKYDNSIDTLIKPMIILRNALEKEKIPLKLGLSAEVRLDFSVLKLLEKNSIPLLKSISSGKRYILLELPDAQVPLGTIELAEKLIEKDITPIIVHPERNKKILRDASPLLNLIALGCRFQITAASLVGQFGSTIESFAWELIQTQGIIAVASDCHNTKGRKPKMRQARDAITKKHGSQVADVLTFKMPSDIYSEFIY